jgi:TctA family transporter
MTPPDSDPQSWLETDATRRVSDIALGVIFLIIGVLALRGAADYPAGSLVSLGPRFFPSFVAVLLCVVAVVLLARAALKRSPPFRRSHPVYAAIVVALVILPAVAIQIWGVPDLFLNFGPAEFTALLVLELTFAVALARSSHLRAAGMALLGLLLSTVGTDVNSGVLRFSMGLEALQDGIVAGVVMLGLFVAGDALVCLGSPPLFLRTYTRLVTAWRPSRIPVPVLVVMRLVAALALAGACYDTYAHSVSTFDVALMLVFGILGAAGKIFAWNRFLLYMGFVLGLMLEENIRRTLLLSRGDPLVLLQRPISAVLVGAAIVVFVIMVALSNRRAARDGKPQPAQA